jgi:hypothetical protein
LDPRKGPCKHVVCCHGQFKSKRTHDRRKNAPPNRNFHGWERDARTTAARDHEDLGLDLANVRENTEIAVPKVLERVKAKKGGTSSWSTSTAFGSTRYRTSVAKSPWAGIPLPWVTEFDGRLVWKAEASERAESAFCSSGNSGGENARVGKWISVPLFYRPEAQNNKERVTKLRCGLLTLDTLTWKSNNPHLRLPGGV